MVRSQTGTAFVMAGLVPAIHVFAREGSKTWMPGTRPGTTMTWLLSRSSFPQKRRPDEITGEIVSNCSVSKR
jgi:hypothetical protein